MPDCERVIALGFFDGLHIGHAELFKKVIKRSMQLNAIPSVLTFDVHPDCMVFGKDPAIITDTKAKSEVLRKYFGIEDLIILGFTEELMNMEYSMFLDWLKNEYSIKGFVVGYDFTFGKNAEGNADKLAEYCGCRGLTCDIVPPVYYEGTIVSSTEIRRLISSGNITIANKMLGYRHFISGTVSHGLHNGHKIGYPTLNIKLPSGAVIPKYGVYAAVVYTELGEYYAAVDIGVKPTVCEDSAVIVESHLFDFSGEIYGSDIKVELYKFIREEKCFDSLSELAGAIEHDVAEIKSYFKI